MKKKLLVSKFVKSLPLPPVNTSPYAVWVLPPRFKTTPKLLLYTTTDYVYIIVNCIN